MTKFILLPLLNMLWATDSRSIEAAYNTFKKESELKSFRIVNKSVFGRLLHSTLSDYNRLVLLQTLDKAVLKSPNAIG
jgi:hypothetical protein